MARLMARSTDLLDNPLCSMIPDRVMKSIARTLISGEAMSLNAADPMTGHPVIGSGTWIKPGLVRSGGGGS